jgi:hypothetical protein
MQHLVDPETLRNLQRHIFQSQSSLNQASHKGFVVVPPFGGTEDI